MRKLIFFSLLLSFYLTNTQSQSLSSKQDFNIHFESYKKRQQELALIWNGFPVNLIKNNTEVNNLLSEDNNAKRFTLSKFNITKEMLLKFEEAMKSVSTVLTNLIENTYGSKDKFISHDFIARVNKYYEVKNNSRLDEQALNVTIRNSDGCNCDVNYVLCLLSCPPLSPTSCRSTCDAAYLGCILGCIIPD